MPDLTAAEQARLRELRPRAIVQLFVEKGWQLRDVALVLQMPLDEARTIAAHFTSDPWKLA